MKVREGDQAKAIVLVLAIVLVFALMGFTVLPKLMGKPAAATDAKSIAEAGTAVSPQSADTTKKPSDAGDLYAVFSGGPMEGANVENPFRRPVRMRNVSNGGPSSSYNRPSNQPPSMPGVIPPADPGTLGVEPGRDTSGVVLTVKGTIVDVNRPGAKAIAVIAVGETVLHLRQGEEVLPAVRIMSVMSNGIKLRVDKEEIFIAIGGSYPPTDGTSAEG